jgi:hypothetical protein
MNEQLVEAVRARRTILFVGAGVSRSLGLPSWNELIAKMAVDLEFDPDVFRGYGGNLDLAEYYQLTKKTIGPLRAELDRLWHRDEAKVDSSQIYQAIVNLRCPTIYTTNYDRWLEIAFRRGGKKAVKIANVGDFTQIEDGTPQIVKLHGDFDDDASLVLTEASYFDRLSFESPLDIKLRSDSIGRTILFIGYSITDINVRLLLYKLHMLWTKSAFSDARPESFIFLQTPNPVQEAILKNRGITPIISENDDPTTGLGTFLERVVREAFGTTPGKT